MNANSYNTPGTTGGNREDLRGPLTILEPEETPFISSIKKGPAPKSTLVEHGGDTLRKPRVSGTREGYSGPKGGNKATKRARFGSYLHRFHESFGVTDIQQLISTGGGNAFVVDEYAHSKAKAVREVKRDIEAVALSDQDGQGGSDDEMRSRGAFKWLADTQTPQVPEAFIPADAQQVTGQADFKEYGANSLNTVLKSLSTVHGKSASYTGYLGVDYIEDADTWTRVDTTSGAIKRNVMEMGERMEISMEVRVFRSSFGRVNIVPELFLRVDQSATSDGDPDAALIASDPHWEFLFLDELHAADDEEDAGGESGYVKGVGGLFCLMPKSSAFYRN